MAEAYCVKCKEKREVTAPGERIVEKGSRRTKMLFGTCSTCGTKVSKILGKAD